MFTFTNITQMPTYITSYDFDTWFDKFNAALNAIKLSPIFAPDTNIHITFSNKEKTNTHGSLSIDQAKKLVKRLWKTDDHIEDILNQIRTSEDYHNEQQGSRLADAICSCNPCEDFEDVLAKLNRIFSDIVFQCNILGEYIHPSKIILYTKNIEKTSSKTYAQAFEAVFAHEMFHAYHYQNSPCELVCRRDYTSTVIKESLASAFEWFYCTKNKIPGAGDLRSSWKHSVFSYPYSGAARFVRQDYTTLDFYLDETFFYDIFDVSLTDMDAPLRRLLHPKDFYDIKNATQIRERYIRETVFTKETSVPLTYAEFGAIQFARKVAEMAKAEIPDIVKAHPNLTAQLLDKNYCDKTFGFKTYSILSTTVIYSGKVARYYKDLPIEVAGTTYYLCNNWTEEHRIALFNWVWENRVEKLYCIPPKKK